MRVTALIACGLLAGSCGLFAKEELPSWLDTAVAAKVPVYDKKVPAVVLLDEESVTVEESGRIVTTSRYAVRVLNREGRDYASAFRSFPSDTGRVRDMRAWTISKAAEWEKVGKERFVEGSMAPGELYTDVRSRGVSIAGKADPGVVFGFESVIEDKPIFTQDEFAFQSRLPVLVSRFTLQLPQQWETRGVVFNHEPIVPTVSNGSSTWELRDLPYLEYEPDSPRVSALAPRLAVSFFPPEGPRRTLGPAFGNWGDVSKWTSQLHDPQAVPTPEIVETAKRLTANAKSEWEQIEAIAKFTQQIRYVAIETGIGRGGGYKPHPAGVVLSVAYGDCKDKANLMRSLLKAVGIESYPVAIYSGDPYYVRDSWASPQQFNHCIIAVLLKSPSTGTPISTVDSPQLGRLLIFDPTDPHTPLGELPQHEQNSFGLICAGDAGWLQKMPLAPKTANRLERSAVVTLTPEGALKGTLTQSGFGSVAAEARNQFHSGEYEKNVQRWIAKAITGINLQHVQASEAHAGQFTLDIDFRAENYAQILQQRLLIFKPSLLEYEGIPSLGEKTRKFPLVLSPQTYAESVKVKLPAGFQVDEVPAAAKIETKFGAFTSEYKVEGGTLIFSEALSIEGGIIPVADYSAARDFFGKVAGASQASVVLVRN